MQGTRSRRRGVGVVVASFVALGGVACSSSAPGGGGSSTSAAPTASSAGGSGATGSRPAGSSVVGSSVPESSGSGTGSGSRRDGISFSTALGELQAPGRGRPFGAMPQALADEHDYVERELVLSGEATSYREAGPWGSDGVWPVEPADTATFATRILVRRPADAARFDGTVVVEWLNVTSGQDTDVVFAHAADEVLRHGSAWVGVSAQRKSIDGTGTSMGVPGAEAVPLTQWDPERYSSLSHPGDDFAYDIYRQAALAVAARGEQLVGAPVRKVIGAGESQSATKLVTYVNAVQPISPVFDGFLILSRSDGGATLNAATTGRPPFAHIRADVDVPVLQVETETDIFGLPFFRGRQPDTDRVRTWEIAGTAHLDQDLVDYLATTERAAPEASTGAPAGDGGALTAACGVVNDGPLAPVLAKAVESLRAWVDGGPPPATSPLIETTGEQIARDELGLALGGIRTPWVDAPTRILRGDNAPERGFLCGLFGSTAPIDPAILAARYPTHDAYVAAVRTSAEAAVAAGFLRQRDADLAIAAATTAPIPA